MRNRVVLPLGLLALIAAAGTSVTLAQQGGPPPGPPLSLKISGFTDGGDVPAKLWLRRGSRRSDDFSGNRLEQRAKSSSVAGADHA